jgi:hypothetical protein
MTYTTNFDIVDSTTDTPEAESLDGVEWIEWAFSH